MVAVIAVQEGRYLMSLAPLAVYFFATGLMLTIRWILHVGRSASVPRQLPRVTFAGCVAIALVALGTAFTQAKPIELFAAPGLRSIFDRLAEVNRSPPSRVAFVNPRVLTSYTGIPAMGFFQASADATIEEFRAKRITHVILGDLDTHPAHERPVARVVEARPDVFHRLYSEGVFTVYAVDAPSAPRP